MTTGATPVAEPSVKNGAFVRNVAWTAGARWGGQALTSGITILVARILTPADYGLIGMGMVFMGLVRFLSEFGIGGSVVVMREFDRERLAALNTCAVLLGCAGLLISAIFAIPLGHFFNAPKLPGLVLASSVGFIVTGFRAVPAAALQRDFRFKLLAGLDLGQSVLAAVITLALAVAGRGFWAIVYGNLVAAFIGTVVTASLSPQRFVRPTLARIRPAVSLSRNITTATLAWYVYSNADFLVVGKMLGQTSLGFYNIGWTLAMLIVERVTTLVGGVAPAYLAEAKHDIAELRRYLFRISGSIALLTFPASLGLALVADDFCRVVLGPRWIGAITPLRLLAVYASIRSLGPILAQLLTVSGEDGFVAKNAIFAAVLMPIAFIVGSRSGVQGVAWAWVIAYPFVTIPLFVRVARKLQIRLWDYVDAIKPALVSAVLMATAVLVFRILTVNAHPVVRLTLSVLLGAAVYSAVLFIGFRAEIESMLRLIRPRARVEQVVA